MTEEFITQQVFVNTCHMPGAVLPTGIDGISRRNMVLALTGFPVKQKMHKYTPTLMKQ